MRSVRICRAVALVSLAAMLLIAARGFAFDQEDLKEAKKRAEEGNPRAELTLGIMYDLGDGVPQNYQEAVKWYQRAANHGNPVAQNNLGVLYLQGQGVPKDYFQAAKWFQSSANLGYAKGQMNLGYMCSEGFGVSQNDANAFYWFQRAANQGDPAAQDAFGIVFLEGKIARLNYVEAYKWFSLAAAQGYEPARKRRDDLAEKMNPDSVAAAQRQAAAFVARNEMTLGSNEPKASGTGFFVTKDGYLVTANHVVEDASRIVVKMKYSILAARVVKVDKTNDLALLKVIGSFPRAAMTNSSLLQLKDSQLGAVAPKFIPLGVVNSSTVKLGDSVSTIGFPNLDLQGSEPKFTRGEVNSIAGIRDDPHFFQISAPVQPGNSGGPLLDRSGNVVGMIQLKLNDLAQLIANGSVPQNVNYALKSAYLLGFLKSFPGVALSDPRGDSNPGTDWINDAQISVAVVLVY